MRQYSNISLVVLHHTNYNTFIIFAYSIGPVYRPLLHSELQATPQQCYANCTDDWGLLHVHCMAQP